MSEPSVDSEFVDEAVASFGATPHFGDPSGEQWALEAGRALVRRPDLAVISVSGADRLTWLTSLASQIVTGLVPGVSRELLILSPEGRVEHWAGASDDGETLHLIVERSDVDSFVAFLDSMRFALRVAVSECDVVVFSSVRAGANTADSVVGLPGLLWTWEDPWPGVVEGGAAYFQGERHPGARTPMMFHAVSRQAADEFEAAWLSAFPEAGSRRRAGYLAWEAMRIAAWKSRLGRETDARAIPPEVDWLRTAVHTAKGCYRGQETIARVLNLGRPPRRLTYLQLDGSRGDLPAPGTPIEVGGRQVGVITSSARHADEGPIALALIARAVPVTTVFDIDGVAAAQEEIVPVHGKSSVSPQTRPGADLSREAGQRGGSTGFGGLGSALGARWCAPSSSGQLRVRFASTARSSAASRFLLVLLATRRGLGLPLRSRRVAWVPPVTSTQPSARPPRRGRVPAERAKASSSSWVSSVATVPLRSRLLLVRSPSCESSTTNVPRSTPVLRSL